MDIKEITLPDGWVIDKQEGNKLILKENKPELDTWEKCIKYLHSKIGLYYINNDSLPIIKVSSNFDSQDINVFPEEYINPMLALMQLLVCYKAWIGDWKPDYKDVNSKKYCIFSDYNRILTTTVTDTQYVLAFPTFDIRDKFLETFKDLLEQAKPLL
jgi:hypothetical protein